jgi:hypothetical protein
MLCAFDQLIRSAVHCLVVAAKTDSKTFPETSQKPLCRSDFSHSGFLLVQQCLSGRSKHLAVKLS